MYSNKQVIIVLAVFIFPALFLGYFVGNTVSKERLGANVVKTDIVANNQDGQTFQDGWEAAKKRIIESNLCLKTGVIETKRVTGTVTSKKNDRLEVKIQPFEILSDPELDIREITVNTETVVYKLSPKTQNVYSDEMRAYYEKQNEIQKKGEKVQEGLENIKIPEYFIKEKADISDVKEGTLINVVVDEDIKYKKSFVAKEIEIMNVGNSVENLE